jgi:hypothetical protein
MVRKFLKNNKTKNPWIFIAGVLENKLGY